MLLEIVDSPASEPNDDDKPALKLDRAQVELLDVAFGYRPDQLVLTRISFIAPPERGRRSSAVSQPSCRCYCASTKWIKGAIVIDKQIISDCLRASLA